MFCPKCGKKIPADSNFCTSCGKNFSKKDDSAGLTEGKPRRFSVLKITIGSILLFAALLVVPFTAYFVKVSKLAVYKHPTKNFSFTYPKSLKIETPALPSDVKCQSPPCLIALKNPAYNDYVVNFIVINSAADLGIEKEKFVSQQTKDLEDIVHGGGATIETIGGQKAYKLTNDSEKSAYVVSAVSKPFGYDAVQTIHMLIFGDYAVAIFTRKAPAGAPADYKGFLDLTSLKLQ
jgi:hypothetical protein